MSNNILVRVIGKMIDKHNLYLKSTEGYYLPDLTVWKHRAMKFQSYEEAEKAILKVSGRENKHAFEIAQM